MRILVVWLNAFAIMFMVTIGWWISQPVVLGVSSGLKSQMSGAGLSVAYAVEYASYVWGPILDVFILLWAFMNSQKRDVESEVYG